MDPRDHDGKLIRASIDEPDRFGGIFDRVANPTERLRQAIVLELGQFMAAARPEVRAYVLEAHEQLIRDVQAKVIANYEERARNTVRLLEEAY
jgi:hypothetical protein